MFYPPPFFLLLILTFTLIFSSCEDSYQDDSFDKKTLYNSENVKELNQFFKNKGLDIVVRNISPASEDLIEKIKKYSIEKQINRNKENPYPEVYIDWQNSEVIEVDGYDREIVVTPVEDIESTEYEVLYTSIDADDVFRQHYFEMSSNYSGSEIDNDPSLIEDSDFQFTLSSAVGLPILEGNTVNNNVEMNVSLMASGEEGCTGECVKETLAEGSAAFIMVCVATGPYCAAAVLISCTGCCVFSSGSCPP